VSAAQSHTRQLSPTEAGASTTTAAGTSSTRSPTSKAASLICRNRTTGLLRVNAPVAFGQLHNASLVFRFRQKYPGLAVDLTLNDRFVTWCRKG